MVRLVELAEVLGIRIERGVLGIGGTRFRAPNQQVGRRLQIDDQIGRRDVGRQQLVQPLIDEQLVVVEIQLREDLVLVEEVVADRELAEQIRLTHRLLLAVAIEEIEELSLERRARPFRVEVREERIFGILEQDGRFEPRAEALSERALAHANRSFDRDVAKLQGCAG